MSNSPDDSGSRDPLEPVLADVEAELRRRLREACEAEASGISSDATSEIRRLEDSLLSAAAAAEQTITLRRHMDRRRAAASDASSAEEYQQRTSGEERRRPSEPNEYREPIFGVREFRDALGQLWRAWPVTPGQARPGRTAHRYLGEFHKGWICFEALESTARRRLPQQPAQWMQLSEPELVQLLDQAISAPERRGGTESATRPPAPPAN